MHIKTGLNKKGILLKIPNKMLSQVQFPARVPLLLLPLSLSAPNAFLPVISTILS